MRKKENIIIVFVVLFLLTLLFTFFVKVSFLGSVRAVAEQLVIPIQSLFFKTTALSLRGANNKDVIALQEENKKLRKQLVDQEIVQKENNALRDQFQSAKQADPQKLLPATVVGAPRLIPGISNPDYFIVNRGENDHVKAGQAVVSGDTLVGKIEKVTAQFAKVRLITAKEFSFTAKTIKTNASGVVKGQGAAEIVFDNVVLSDELSTGDSVVTQGDINEKGIGFMPNLIVGKIISVDKKPSALFQSAKIKSAIDSNKLSLVFIAIGY